MSPALVLWAALGSGLGAGLRWTLSLLMAGAGHGLPWATLAVNALGALVAGFYMGRHGPGSARPHRVAAQVFMLPGLCAGFTTFSIFSLEAVHHFAGHGAGAAFGLVLASVATWLVAVALGDWLGRRF
ncbi:MAG: CrcB family protein [Xanthomonadales bacterium]|nr:CrcB family protein [Xanthomonadales bacterium]